MLKKLSLALALAAAATTASAADETKVVTDAILALVPNAKVDSVTKSQLPGFYEVVTGGQVVYVSADGKYLLQGALFDMSNKKDLTEARLSGLRKDLVDKIPKSKRIVFSPKDPKYTVTVFTDIDCGYCRKLHNDIAKYNEQGIAIEYLWFPRSGPNTPSFDKAVSVWCAADRNKAFTDAKAGADPKSAKCDNPVSEEFELGQRVGINGTPSVIAPNGTQIGGYLPPEAMRQRLDALAAAK
ncbi:DsbC family protein [Tahibacter soli]|jgi:thiol:disulfide interchange protein DsbC|uniref:Thiol:disulfide interchange protein n=1 Tax=Tahibacter soli TaxID=2983605 RepID=A0A9X4BLW9_9GAMM|nr:DsbC family protein [Tahibacter soli]MDC8014714.1 DsbC family protein [Tahibacter soli]